MRLLALGWLMGIVVLVLTRDRMGSTVMLTFFPSAVFLGKYVESIGRDFFRELVLGGSVLVSLGVFFSQWVLK
jgi:carbon starvation protein CstA